MPTIEPLYFRCSCSGMAVSQGWKTHACPKQSSQRAPRRKARTWCPKKALQRLSKETACTGRESAIGHGSGRTRTEAVGVRQGERPVVTSRKRGRKPRRKDEEGRKSEQPPYHPHLKPSPVQSAVGLHVKLQILQPPTGLQELNHILPKST